MPERLRHDLAKLSSSLIFETSRFAGLWHLSNGKILAAMAGRYDVRVTTDKSLRYDQNMAGRSIAIVVIASVNNDIALLRLTMPKVIAAIAIIRPGDVIEV